MGGGKTTFVRGLAKGLGSSDIVSSPTFTLTKNYKIIKGNLYHYDFYRLTEPGVLKDELQESLNDIAAVTVIEWSDIVKDVLPEQRLSIKFAPTANNSDERQISIKYPESLRGIVVEVESNWEEIKP